MVESAKSSGSTGVSRDMPVGSAVPVCWAWLASLVAGVSALSFSYKDHCFQLHCHLALLGNLWQRWHRYPKKTWLPQRYISDCLRRGIACGCFRVTAESNGGSPKCCIRKLAIFALQNAKRC